MERDLKVINNKEELYDKCENIEQLYDNYYLPLLNRLEEARKYLTSYEIIHIMQFNSEKDNEKDKTSNIGLDNVTIECMISRYLKIQRKLLKILGDE